MLNNKPRESYIRGYLIPNFYVEANIGKFEDVRDITNDIGFVDEYLSSLSRIFALLFEDVIKNVTQLEKANDLFVLLTYGGLSQYWYDMVINWLESNFSNFSDSIKSECETFFALSEKFNNTFPVDDRPGLNTSSLLIHLIATSALAVCIAKQKETSEGISELNKQCIRTSSFFHAVGIPISRFNSIDNSIELFEKHFKTLFSEEIYQTIIVIIRGIQDDNSSNASRYVRFGSRLSLASEQLLKLTKIVLSNEKEVIENFNNSDFWESNEHRVKELTQQFVSGYEKALLNQPPVNLDYKENGSIALLRGDVRHIHEYTDRVQKLEELRNASKLLDHALSNMLVTKLITDKKLCPEQIIYSSGGNIILFCPASQVQDMARYIESTFYESTHKGLKMTTDYIYFFDEVDEKEQKFEDSFGDLYSKLAIKIGAKKNDLSKKEKNPVLFGSSRLCDSCGSKMATEIIPFSNTELKYYCKPCLYKFKLPDPEVRNLSLQEGVWKNIYKDISQNLMEFISGVRLEDISKGIEPHPHKLAILNADGNLLSEFIAKSISLSDLYSRINRISNSVREILETIIGENMIKHIFNQEFDYARFDIGKVYSGGDDILLLLPAYLAIPVALTLTKEFYKKMGTKCTLSTGIFLCPNKFPIWSAITTARLLLKNAKKEGRLCEGNELGVIDFQSFSSGLTVPEFVKDKDSNDGRRSFSRRPFKVNLQNSKSVQDVEDIQYLINTVIGRDYQLNFTLEENYSSLYQFVKEELRLVYDRSGSTPSVLKDLRNKSKRVSAFFSFDPKKFKKEKQMALSFVLYQTSRQKELLGKTTYIKLFNLIGSSFLEGNEKDFLLFDSLETLKFLSGGLL